MLSVLSYCISKTVSWIHWIKFSTSATTNAIDPIELCLKLPPKNCFTISFFFLVSKSIFINSHRELIAAHSTIRNIQIAFVYGIVTHCINLNYCIGGLYFMKYERRKFSEAKINGKCLNYLFREALL